MFKSRKRSLQHKPAVRIIENDLGKAYRIAKALHKQYGEFSWFKGTELQQLKEEYIIKIHVSDPRHIDDKLAVEGISVHTHNKYGDTQ